MILLRTLAVSVALGGAGLAVPTAAQGAAPPLALTSEDGFARFVPRPDGSTPRIDYERWDEALRYFVLRMGSSLRQGASRPDPGMGTRIVYGHDSRVRLEGNRIIFSFLDDDIKAALSEYRADLERIGSENDITALPRNEQLAFWINLHNVAVIERIAQAYPVQNPSRMRIDGETRALDDVPLVTVAGVRLSPRDIRTGIVYPNWRDPRVIYGFFRGDIGGPSIQREAYTGQNVGRMLNDSAEEFVNSLRGTQKRGDDLQVSRIYEEARSYFFPDWPSDLRAHIARYAEDDVKELLAETSGVRADFYEEDIADLAKGENEPTYSTILVNDRVQTARITPSIVRLLRERDEKIEEQIRRNGRTGRVILLDLDGVTNAEIE